MANALARQEQPLAEQIEQVVVGGDLSNLNASQRVSYYHKVCESVGLNPLTRPFEYLRLNGKLVLYARRDAADQLRTIHGISLSKPHIEYVDDLVIVTIEAANKNGRTDTDMGAVSCKGLQGEAKANAMMKAITKAKRRVTLSLAGLGWLDETEIDSIPGAQRVVVTETGEIVDGATGEIVEPKQITTPTQAKSAPRNESFHDEPPPMDNPFDDAPPPPVEEPAKPAVLTDAELKRFNTVGVELYGKDEWEEQRPKLVKAVSNNKVDSSKKLTSAQATQLIRGMENKLKEVAALKAQAATESQAQPVAA